MLIRNIISELRREPEKNPKIVGHAGAYKRLEELKGQYGSLDNFGVSMTEIPKLGVNPRSEYDTPLGIYFYPAEYYMDVQRNKKTLPFQGNAQYIQIFNWNTDRILDVSNLTEEEYKQDLKLLSNEYGLSYLKELAVDQTPLVDTYGGRLWIFMWLIAQQESKQSLFWNKMIRDVLNYDIVIDDRGKGIIHVSEPYAGVVVNPRVVKHIDTIQQKYHSTEQPHRQWDPMDLAWWAVDHKTKLSPNLEKHLIKSPLALRTYLLQVNPHWHSGIAQAKVDPELAYVYAKTILKRPWPDAEPYIAKDSKWAKVYARDILNDPDPGSWANQYNEKT